MLGNGSLADRQDYVDLADYDGEMPEQFDAAWNWREQNQYFQERFCARLIARIGTVLERAVRDVQRRRMVRPHESSPPRAALSGLLPRPL